MGDNVYKRIASEYIEQTGAELRRELDAEPTVTQLTPGLDRRVKMRIGALRRARTRRIVGLIAACVVLVALIPAFFLQSKPEADTAPDDSTGRSDAAPEPQEYEVIQLGFALPERFSVASVEQDVAKTVYYLEDAELDDIVMILERGGDTAFFRELEPVQIGAYTAYGRVEDGYSLLAAFQGDVLYVMTCEHDINTLIELGSAIFS